MSTARRKDRRSNGRPRPSRARVSRQKAEFCTCRGQDDGRPMIHCSHCDDWFHFECVQLDQADAEEIEVYVCPPCQQSTGLRPVRQWEGPDAVEDATHVDEPKAVDADEDAPSPHPPTPPEISEDEASGDDYVEAEGSRSKRAQKRARRVSVSDDEGVSSDAGASARPAKARRASGAVRRLPSSSPPGSPAPSRRASDAGPGAKRRRATTSPPSAAGDPARKYCLGKLLELFVPIFLRYPHVAGAGAGAEAEHDAEAENGAEAEQGALVLKDASALSDEDKQAVERAAHAFTTELEQVMFELYSERDQKGKSAVGGKYKERFRMITFNLGQDDRVAIHMRIASGELGGREVAVADSAALANAATQASIAAAAAESLAQTILRTTAAPRAKITHKGLQDIELDDVAPAAAKQRAAEEEEEDARREQERFARVRPQRSASMSVPPESPVVPSTPGGWGGPPPLPGHALQAGDGMAVVESPTSMTRPPLYTPMGSDFEAPVAPNLNLSDFINFGEDDPAPAPTGSAPSTPAHERPAMPMSMPSDVFQHDMPTPSTPQKATPFDLSSASTLPPTEPSPTAATFDINALWSQSGGSVAPDLGADMPEGDPAMDIDLGMGMGDDGANEPDFDMFLRDDDAADAPAPATATAPPAPPPAEELPFEHRPEVWAGTLSMPLDSTVPQETPVAARQVAGRKLEATSLLWRTLFPSAQLRIDGRVPIDKSSHYLLQMRMNSSKELFAVAFSAATEETKFQALVDYLIQKGRHGLIFPWGSRPKEHHPGRELYIVPLLAHEPVPDYIDLLDDVDLPKTRTSSYLIGIWVLSKGKLAPPPGMSTASASLPRAAIPAPVAAKASYPEATAVPAGPPAIHTPPSVPSAAAAPQLAAQVAALTPEQIQAMLRTLSASSLLPQTAAAPPPAAPALPPPPVLPMVPGPPPSGASYPPPPPFAGPPPFVHGQHGRPPGAPTPPLPPMSASGFPLTPAAPPPPRWNGPPPAAPPPFAQHYPPPPGMGAQGPLPPYQAGPGFQAPPPPPFQGGAPFRDGPPGPPFRDGPPGPPFRDGPPGPPFRDGPPGPPFRDGAPGHDQWRGPGGPHGSPHGVSPGGSPGGPPGRGRGRGRGGRGRGGDDRFRGGPDGGWARGRGRASGPPGDYRW